MKYNYCVKCGGKLREIFLSEENHTRLKCSECGFVFYLNSKPTGSALIVEGDKVLLGKRKIEPAKGDWDVIGGFLEPGEHPEDGTRREAKEEIGIDVEIKELLGIFMDVYGVDQEPTLNICYLVGLKSRKKLIPGDGIEELRWFSADKLPKNLAFENGRKMLGAWIRRLN
jgi:8-oxo-dGTP diphosphatase